MADLRNMLNTGKSKARKFPGENTDAFYNVHKRHHIAYTLYFVYEKTVICLV